MIFTKDNRTNLEKEIDRVIEEMKSLSPDTDEYSKKASNLVKLCEANSKTHRKGVKLDTLIPPLVVGGISLVQTIMILFREETNVVTSKALGFVIRGRV